MATKEEALEDFLKCFRISLNFILLYSKDHKSFRKSIADLKEKTEAFFVFLSPIEINFASEAIFIEGVEYSKMILHRELAALFHLRKIQSLSFEPGITEDELVILLDKLSLAPKDIIKSGGLAQIFSGILKNPHFSVTDLDYSQLLRGEGEEVKDIWLFMLHDAVARGQLQKISELADNFEVMIQKFKARDLVEDAELNSDLHEFLNQLKKADPGKFIRACRAILKFIIKDKSILMDDEKINRLKTFLSELAVEDYSQIIWNEIVSDSKFDVSSFQLFSKFLSNEQHEKIAGHLFGNLSDQGRGNLPAHVSRKIRELFLASPEGGSPVSEIYRRAILGSSAKAIFEENELVFDRKQVVNNYRYILLNLLLQEKDSRQLEAIVDKLFKEWDKIVEEKNAQYLKCLGEVIRKLKAQDLASSRFLELNREFDNFAESFIWQETAPAGFAEFFETMETSSLGFEFYLKKIFEEDKINSRVLKAFFRFFPQKLPDFFARLKDKSADIDFMAKLVESLKETDSPLILTVLESIYAFSNDVIKIEIIRIMALTGKYNREFILEVLKNAGSFIRKEALAVFSEQRDNQKAMEILFMLPNPWGKNNAILEENLGIVEELKYKQAGQYLEHLYRNTAFWNFVLKKRIKQVLGGLNV
jgi:hypothetical protein